MFTNMEVCKFILGIQEPGTTSRDFHIKLEIIKANLTYVGLAGCPF